ncbi:MAG: UvrD-helicase domain-containing protein, partial [Candidatus Obscuribacterales bacterium]|nr:UvrD-helicase domain-containing protein [Candidatus Obscuribacterales bacterium]
ETMSPIRSLLKARLDSELFEKLSLYSWRELGEKILSENLTAIKRKNSLKIEFQPHKVLQRLLVKHLKELDPAIVDLSKGLDEFTISSIIALYKARMISAKKAKDDARDKMSEIVAKIYLAYEEQLQRSNKIDENDFVSQAVYLLLDRSDIRVRYQNQFDYVLIDELQDATPAEDMLARIIAGPQDNLFVAGDDDQAILSQSGGSPKLLSEISHRSPWTKCYLLAKNWRSDSQITEKSALVLSLFDARGIQKGLISGWQKTNKPAVVGPQKYANEREEIDEVAKEIGALISLGHKPKDIAVITRQGRYRELMENALRRKGVVFTTRERPEGFAPNERLDMLSYLRLICDPDGPRAKEDFERICQIRYKDVDPKIASTIASFAEANNLSFMRAVEIYSEATADKACRELEQLVRVIRNMHQEKLPPAETIALLKRTQRLNDHYSSFRVPPDVYYEPMSTIGELEIAAKDFLTVNDFLKYLSASRDLVVPDETTGGVAVLSVQETKGKEFPAVFLVGLSQGTFPCTENCDLEVEKKLFYVALTRAQAVLYLSFAAEVKDVPQEPSEYLQHLGYFLVDKPQAVETVAPKAVAPPASGIGRPVSPSKLVKEPPRPKLVEPPKEVEPVKLKEVKTPAANERIKIETTPATPPARKIPPAAQVEEPPKIVESPAIPEPAPVPEPAPEPVIAAQTKEPVPPIIELEPKPVEPVVPVKKEQLRTPVVKAPPPVPRAKASAPPPEEEKLVVVVPTKPEPKPTVCPACLSAIEGDAKFCGECGCPTLSIGLAPEAVPYTVVSKEDLICPACSAEMEMGAKFCGECGYKTS